MGQAELGPADWLRICDGFDVDFPDGRRGRASELSHRSHAIRPDVVLVRTGRLGRRVIAGSVDDIQTVLPNERRLVLRSREAEAGARRDRCNVAGGIVRFPAPHLLRHEATDEAAHG